MRYRLDLTHLCAFSRDIHATTAPNEGVRVPLKKKQNAPGGAKEGEDRGAGVRLGAEGGEDPVPGGCAGAGGQPQA